MALANGANPAHSPHVPAWKRLGLKLKYAKDTAEPPSTSQQPTPPESTSAKDRDSSPATLSAHNEDGRPSKKRKTSSKSQSATQSASESLANDISSAGQPTLGESSSDAVEPTARVSVETEPFTSAQEPAKTDTFKGRTTAEGRPPDKPKRRKSVTFTGETKQVDGTSAKSFTDPTPETSTWKSALPTSESTSAQEEPTKKAKKSKESPIQDDQSRPTSKKEKKAKKSTSSSAISETPEYVRYLEHFQQDKASWKFSKNHQTNLLKNLFDVRIVPASLTPAVVDYISGLQGAGPRERLIQDATAILRNFAEKDGGLDEVYAMNTETGRREAYFRAMARELRKWEEAGMPRSEYDDGQIEEMNMEIEKGKRADAVLRVLPLSESWTQTASSSTQASTAEVSQMSRSTGIQTSPPQTTNTSISQPKTSTRKRKRRTDAASDSSSSDSDSSSSDSEEDTASKRPASGPKAVAAALRPTPESPPPKSKPAPSRTPAYQHDDLNMSYRPQNASQLFNANVKPTKKFFDDDLLDAAFPKQRTYNEVAPKRRKRDQDTKARGFAYTHGTRVDESGSEDDD